MNNLPTPQSQNKITKINSALPTLSTYRKPVFDHSIGQIVAEEFDVPDDFMEANPELFQPIGFDAALHLVEMLAVVKRIDGNAGRIAIITKGIAREIADQPAFAVLAAFRDIKLTPGGFMPDVGTVVQMVKSAGRIKHRKAEKPREPDFVRDDAKRRRRCIRWASIARKSCGTRTPWEKKFIAAYQPGKGL